MKPNEGDISTPNKITIGFLKQDLEFHSGRSVKEEAEQAFVEIKKIEEEIEQVNLELESRTDYESQSYLDLITSLNALEERFRLLDGYSIQSI